VITSEQITIVHDSQETPGRKGWYEWSIYLESEPRIMERIDKVWYHLHPTFPQPHILVDDRTNGFRLKDTGWGQFIIMVDIFLKEGGEMISKRHYLRLGCPYGKYK
jgi:transcription initiation factor IIF auxiliary subunit